MKYMYETMARSFFALLDAQCHRNHVVQPSGSAAVPAGVGNSSGG
jgi:hypothetical protein